MKAWTFAAASARCHKSVNNMRVTIPIGIKSLLNPASSASSCCLTSLSAQVLQTPEVERLVLKKLGEVCIKSTAFEEFSQLCCVFQLFPATWTAATYSH